jgi:hypothetical protein
MPVTACVPTVAKVAMMNVYAAHTIKCALYTQAAATLDASTTVYTATGEVAASGTYSAGGITMSGISITSTGTTAYIDWTVDPQWTGATITADAAMFYDTSDANKVIAIVTFASASSTNGTWTLQLPAPGVTAIIRAA